LSNLADPSWVDWYIAINENTLVHFDIASLSSGGIARGFCAGYIAEKRMPAEAGND